MTIDQFVFGNEISKNWELAGKELSVEDKTQILMLYLQKVIEADDVEINNFLYGGVTIDTIDIIKHAKPVNNNYYEFWEEVTKRFPKLVWRRNIYELSLGKDKTVYDFLNKLNEKKDVPGICDLAYVTCLIK